MIKNIKIAALLVVYRDKIAATNCINALLKQDYALDKVVVVDNSEEKVFNLNSFEDKRIVIIAAEENFGVAGGLLLGFEYAIKHGIDWCWTFDQDSEPYTNALSELINQLELIQVKNEKIGIIASTGISRLYNTLYSGNYAKWLRHKKPLNRRKATFECDLVLTAGSLTNMIFIKEFGATAKNFFIDWVDFELCMRMRKNKYKVFSCQTSFYSHQIGGDEILYSKGERDEKNINYLRFYCSIRNATYVICYLSSGCRLFMYLMYFLSREYLKIMFDSNSRCLFFLGVYHGIIKKINNPVVVLNSEKKG
ncbi:MAG: hypothetical protein A2306_10420 [Omnitrophica WOR_2 bacterium RIFOXYB2_FULL_38_16]|nr:MAG: hypothetical protein A2243_04580 [Omnitrophica WOR_2 bacterium RIFOXYA2_FULL_38_17]OGX58660.1 MAG: hypothetical protein A2306_10420 [Omnitrophica WOR_2 bacterium RIFOXYB2_FULL_38_16]